MYRHIRNSSLEAWCVRIPLTTVISANVIIVETELYSNKSTLLKPLKLEWNVAVMKMKRFKWLGISEKTKFSGLLAKVLHRGVVSKLYERFLSVLPSFLLHSFTKRKQATAFEECKLRLKEPILCHDAIWLFTKHDMWMARCANVDPLAQNTDHHIYLCYLA